LDGFCNTTLSKRWEKGNSLRGKGVIILAEEKGCGRAVILWVPKRTVKKKTAWGGAKSERRIEKRNGGGVSL